MPDKRKSRCWFGGVPGTSASSLPGRQPVLTMALFGSRSGVPWSISQGNATATRHGAAPGAGGAGAATGLSGVSRMPEGKATVAAFMDADIHMVVPLCNDRYRKAQEARGGLGRGRPLKLG